MSDPETVAEPAKTTPFWKWPGEWVRDDKFWREVTARALSGLIVIFVAYWVAVLFGILQTPSALLMANQIFIGFALAVSMLIVGAWFVASQRTRVNIQTMAHITGDVICALSRSSKPAPKSPAHLHDHCLYLRLLHGGYLHSL